VLSLPDFGEENLLRFGATSKIQSVDRQIRITITKERIDGGMEKKKLNALPMKSPRVVRPKPRPGFSGSLATMIQRVIDVTILNMKRPRQHKTTCWVKKANSGAEMMSEQAATVLAPKRSAKRPPANLPAKTAREGTR